ncbi:hypothetical protein HKD37_01G001417 [Glycine soja]
MKNEDSSWFLSYGSFLLGGLKTKELEEAKEHHLDEDALIPHDASSIGASRPRIFFINGFLCSLEDEWQRNGEGRERGDATSRRR